MSDEYGGFIRYLRTAVTEARIAELEKEIEQLKRQLEDAIHAIKALNFKCTLCDKSNVKT